MNIATNASHFGDFSRRHKICFVNANYHLGGAETVMHQLIEASKRCGLEFQVILPTAGKQHPKANIKLLYPRVFDRLRYTRFKPFIERLVPPVSYQSKSFFRIAQRNADLVHVHSYTGYADIKSLAAIAKLKPVLWTLHCYWGLGSEFEGSKRYPAAFGLAPQLLRNPKCATELQGLNDELAPLYKSPLWISTPSASAAEAARRCPELKAWKIHHIPNGISIPESVRNGESEVVGRVGYDRPTILIVNRDFKIEDKGFPIITEALVALPQKTVAKIVLVGHHATWAAQQLPSKFAAVGYEFVASRKKMFELYAQADIFLFASRRENFPCVTLEAMATGLCVVATPTDGVKEQIVSGEHGLLSEQIDGTQLGRKLADVMADQALRTRLGQNARKRVLDEFSEEQMVAKFLDVYEQMIRSPQS